MGQKETDFSQQTRYPTTLTLNFEQGETIWLTLPDGSEIRLRSIYKQQSVGIARRISITASRGIMIERDVLRSRRLIEETIRAEKRQRS